MRTRSVALLATATPGGATPADAAMNHTRRGVDTPAGVTGKSHPGGIIGFTWANTRRNPRLTTTLTNGSPARDDATAPHGRLPVQNPGRCPYGYGLTWRVR
jgi:hypothetical protein